MADEKKKARLKVAQFIPGWLERSIDGQRVAMWLQPDPDKKDRATCTLCPKPNSFSINEGWKSVTQHNSTAKHKTNLAASQQNPDFKQVHLLIIVLLLRDDFIKTWRIVVFDIKFKKIF